MIGLAVHAYDPKYTVVLMCTQSNTSLFPVQKQPVCLIWQQPKLRHSLNKIFKLVKAISVTSLNLYLLPLVTIPV